MSTNSACAFSISALSSSRYATASNARPVASPATRIAVRDPHAIAKPASTDFSAPGWLAPFLRVFRLLLRLCIDPPLAEKFDLGWVETRWDARYGLGDLVVLLRVRPCWHGALRTFEGGYWTVDEVAP